MNETTTTPTRAEQWRAATTTPTLAEQRRAGDPPAPNSLMIAIRIIATLAIIAGGLTAITWAYNEATGTEGTVGIAAFFIGWLFLGFAYALRKLQLIEWRMQNRATRS